MAEIRPSKYGPIEALLTRTRRRALGVSAGIGVCLALAVALGLGGISAGVLGALGERWAGVARFLVPATAAVVIAAALFFLFVFVLRPLSRLGADTAVARFLERAVPSAAGIASAVEFHRAPASERAGWSEALADAHVERVARAAGRVDPRPAIPTRSLGRAAIGLGVVGALSGAGLGLFGPTFSAGYRRLLGLERPIGTLTGRASTGVPTLITGDVELTYRYPGYTRLPPRTVSGTGGNISALKGTEVEIKTTADRDVKAAALVLGPTKLPLSVTGKRALDGRMVIDKPGSYRFRFLGGGGKTVAEGAPHRITVVPDAYPKVNASIVGKDKDEVEVRDQDHLVVRWHASDDFGLTKLALVYRVKGGGKTRVELAHPDDHSRDEGSHEWDLSTLHLAPGDRVAWYVEALDDDAVSGPKKGVSRTRYLKVFSAAEHHRELMAEVDKLWEAMIGRLGDHLETPFGVKGGDSRADSAAAIKGAEGLTRGLDHLVASMDATLGKLGEDTLTPRTMLDALTNIRGGIARAASRSKDALHYFRRRLAVQDGADPAFAELVRRSHQDAVSELEKDVLYLEDLLDHQRMEDLVAMAQEIKAHKRRLAELIDQLKKHPDEATRAAISEEIARIKQRITDLMQKMAQLAQGINDEHLNAEALAQLTKNKDLLSGLDDVQRLLNEGKLDEALKRLARMSDQLDQMLASWQKQNKGFGSQKYRELTRKMMQFADQLERVRHDQDRLLQQANKLKQRYQKALEKRVKGKIDDLVKRLVKKSNQAQAALRGIAPEVFQGVFARFDEDLQKSAIDRLKNTSMLLGAHDFGEARATAARAHQQAASLESSLAEKSEEMGRLLKQHSSKLDDAVKRAQAVQKAAKDIVDELDKLFPDPQEVFDRDDQRRMAKMSRKQEELRRRAQGLQQSMDDISKKAPIFSPSMQGDLQRAMGHMSQASQRLARSDARRATGHEKAALDGLGRLQKEMEKAMQNGGGGGIPMPLAGGAGGGMDGPYGMSHEKVKIPDADSFKAPAAFRKELLDAMKQGAPKKYQQQLKAYYEELVK